MSAKWRKLIVATAFVGIPNVGLAACPANIADVLGQVEPSQPAQEAFNVLAECIIEQASQIAELTKKLENSVPATGDDLNTAAIIAFTADKGDRTCPFGWSPFEPAKDRFVVGASAGGNHLGYSIESPPVNSLGGEAVVTLKVAQMPRHTHNIEWAGPDIAISGVSSGTTFGVRGTNGPTKTFSAGESQSHNNMPPYIALYFCKKD